MKNDTIVAQATPNGRGGVGIVRISGALVKTIAEIMLPQLPKPRMALLCDFLNDDGRVLDNGLALYFPAPHSFTGEDVLELQGHGGPVVMDRIIKRALHLGARMARPGEFSERAFLNDKLDLAQAEAIADLIDAQSEQAARSALRSLQGEFSARINTVLEKLIHLRTYVEASIDFPEEDIDFLAQGKVAEQLQDIAQELQRVLCSAQQGAILRDGMTVVIAGKPNAGKSSLLNALSGRDSAIVTNIAGTTRDILREQIQIDGMPLHILDTAGLRESDDVIEQQGIQRAWQEIKNADAILWVIDSSNSENNVAQDHQELLALEKPMIIVWNKIDLLDNAGVQHFEPSNAIQILLSAKTGLGLDELRAGLKNIIGYQSTAENTFTARRRHIDALQRAQQAIVNAQGQLTHHAGELVAEELSQAQQALGEITGKFSSDALLGEIFSSFCIGK